MKLRVTKVRYDAVVTKGALFFCDEEDTVVAPNSVVLLKTGVKIAVPCEYKLDIKLIEDFIDSDIVLLGDTVAPLKMGAELGLIVSNVGRKQLRIDTGTKIATYNIIKYEDYELEDLDGVD
jgi:dUTPase